MSLLWTPEQDAGCVMWLDPADDANVILDANGLVERLTDKAGNGHDAIQPDAAYRPIRAMSHLEFAGGEYLDISTLVLSGSGYLLASAASIRDGAAQLGRLLSGRASGSADDVSSGGLRLLFFAGGSAPYFVFEPDTNAGSRIRPTAYNRGNVVVGALHASAIALYLDGVPGPVAAASKALNTTGGVRVGCRIYSPADYWDGSVGDVIVTSDDSAANRERLEGYLAHKWGLSAQLPFDHPYRATPPAAGGAALSGTVALSARRVVHFRPSSGECLSSVQPDPSTGAWSTTLPQVDDVYMAVTGDAPCQPIVDGPYDLTGG